jgi:hypothetical protein
VRARLPEGARSVVLLEPSPSAVPPLDLLRLGTSLRESGCDVRLHRGTLSGAADSPPPDVTIVTGVFSWDYPAVKRELAWVAEHWQGSTRLLTGVLARREGAPFARSLGARLLATSEMEARLDEVRPDYELVPEWDCSILITSKFEYRPGAGLAICPRACAHCRMPKGAGALPPIRLISAFAEHLEPRHESVAVWDNTLMLTPRDHFERVSATLGAHGKPVDLSCGLMPAGVAEDELMWRYDALARHGVAMAQRLRLECNHTDELGRFARMLAAVRACGLAHDVECFAVVNASEPPDAATRRLEAIAGMGVHVEVVYFTPHDWFDERPFVNTPCGWTATALRRVHGRYGGFVRNLELATDDAPTSGVRDLRKSMADFVQQN